MRSKLWFLISFLLLLAGGGITCYTRIYYLSEGRFEVKWGLLHESGPFAILILFAWIFKVGKAKSLTMLIASGVIFVAAVKSCYPIVVNPQDIIFPLLLLKITEKVLFIILIPLLMLAHIFDSSDPNAKRKSQSHIGVN